MPFNIGVTGLNAAAADLKVTGNNIANVETTGFKESRAEFGDIFASTFANVSKTAIGQGARVLSVTQLFKQGNIELTGNGLDLAISGEGFFVLKDTDESRVFTRAGEFQVDREGYIVNNQGQKLQGYEPVDPEDTDTTFNVGTMTDIQLLTGDAKPQATTEVEALVNLRSDAELPETDWSSLGDPWENPSPTMYNFSTSVTVYDSLGTPRTATMYFVKPPDTGDDDGDGNTDEPAPLKWEVYVGMADASGNISSASPGSVDAAGTETDGTGRNGSSVLTFSPEGELVEINDQAIADTGEKLQLLYPNDGTDPRAPEQFPNGAYAIGDTANPQAEGRLATLDLNNSTQYGVKYSVNDMTQDGFTTGRLAGIDIDETGRVFARFTNGQSQILSQVALANFTNPQGLAQLGSNNWAETYAAGDPVYGAPATGDLGQIEAGSLETSNVDLAEELVDLITGQRNYQANAKTIQTADAITQTLINLR